MKNDILHASNAAPAHYPPKSCDSSSSIHRVASDVVHVFAESRVIRSTMLRFRPDVFAPNACARPASVRRNPHARSALAPWIEIVTIIVDEIVPVNCQTGSRSIWHLPCRPTFPVGQWRKGSCRDSARECLQSYSLPAGPTRFCDARVGNTHSPPYSPACN